MFSYRITVEPIMLLLTIAGFGIMTMKPSNDYEKFARTFDEELSYMTSKERDDFLQTKIATWQQYAMAIYVPVSLTTGIFYGAYSDTHGRQINMLIGLASLLIQMVVQMAVYSSALDGPIWLILVGTFVVSLGETDMLTGNACYAYVIDVVAPKRLAVHFMGLMLANNSGGFLGGAAALLLSRKLPFSYFLALGIVVTTVAVFYILFFIRQFPPPSKHVGELQEQAAAANVAQPQRKQQSFSVVNAYRLSVVSLRDSAKVFFVRRQGHTRAFLWVILLSDTIVQLVLTEYYMLLLGIYVLREPIGWRAPEYSLFFAITGLTNLVGLPLSLLVLRRWLKVRNSCLIVIGSLFCAARFATIAFAVDGTLIYLSSFIAVADVVNLIGSKAFLGSLLTPNEVGKYLAISTIVGRLAVLALSLLVAQLYKWSIDVGLFHGFVWLVVSAVALTNAALTAWMHFVSKREHIGS